MLISGGFWLLAGVEILTVFERRVLALLYHLTGRLPQFATPVAGVFFLLLGIILASVGIRQTTRTLLFELDPGRADNVVDIMFSRRLLRRGPHVVAIGGGTGLSTLLRGLKEYTSNITAIVTVADDGGSSGRLREDFGVLPPGDIRNTLVALADAEPLMQELFQHRFPGDNALSGHSFGNLFITAMNQIAGDFDEAIQLSSKVLAIRGKVLPSTLQSVVLKAEYTDGHIVTGESNIPLERKRIRRVFIEPHDVVPLDEALQAIAAADIIVLGPGSLYTSVMPNLLVAALVEEIRKSAAVRVYICNVMTQPGETDGYTASDHLRAIIDHVGPNFVHYCLMNNTPIAEASAERYRAQGAYPVVNDPAEVRALGAIPVMRPLINESNLVRHDPKRLAAAVLELAKHHRMRRYVLKFGK